MNLLLLLVVVCCLFLGTVECLASGAQSSSFVAASKNEIEIEDSSSIESLEQQEELSGHGHYHSNLRMPTKKFDEKIAEQMVVYASAVTCTDKRMMENWDCKICRHGSGEIPPAPVLRNVTLIDSKDKINQAFVGYDPNNNRIVASFRGSVAVWQYFFDIDVLLVQAYCEHCLVHQGFYDAFLDLAKETLEAIEKISTAYQTRDVWVTGHSLGAAMAVHSAIALAMKEEGYRITSYTYGQPRLGNQAFAEFARSKFDSFYRIVNYKDPVPQCFKLPEYHHMTTEVFYYDKPEPDHKPGHFKVCSEEAGEDPNCQDKFCGGFHLCLNGKYHTTYMNLHGITDVDLIC